MTLYFDKEPSHNVNWLRERPIAHRSLHDKTTGIYENTLSAARAAVAKNYPIELDLQPSADCVPMVFHDYELERMTGEQESIRNLPCRQLTNMSILDSEDRIPTLEAFLDQVNGRVGLVIELKGQQGKDDGFVSAVAGLLDRYDGPAVIMSFHHHLLRDAREHAPHLPLGLTAEGDDSRYNMHRKISEECNVDFVSYNVKGLETRFAKEFRDTGRPMISWTIRDRDQYEYSLRFSDQATFEGVEI